MRNTSKSNDIGKKGSQTGRDLTGFMNPIHECAALDRNRYRRHTTAHEPGITRRRRHVCPRPRQSRWPGAHTCPGGAPDVPRPAGRQARIDLPAAGLPGAARRKAPAGRAPGKVVRRRPGDHRQRRPAGDGPGGHRVEQPPVYRARDRTRHGPAVRTGRPAARQRAGGLLARGDAAGARCGRGDPRLRLAPDAPDRPSRGGTDPASRPDARAAFLVAERDPWATAARRPGA